MKTSYSVVYTYRIYLPFPVYQNTNTLFPIKGQNEKLQVHKQEELLIDKERHIDLHNIKQKDISGVHSLTKGCYLYSM